MNKRPRPTRNIVSKSSATQDEIRSINAAYLALAQRLLLDDRTRAMLYLGLSEQAADLLADLTPVQAARLVSSSHLLCRFRFDDHSVLSSLSEDRQPACACADTPIAIRT
jgi:flagellar transcriptional activator FlhD